MSEIAIAADGIARGAPNGSRSAELESTGHRGVPGQAGQGGRASCRRTLAAAPSLGSQDRHRAGLSGELSEVGRTGTDVSDLGAAQKSGPGRHFLEEGNATGAVLVGRRTVEQVDHW